MLVTEAGILDRETYEAVKDDIEQLSRGTEARLEVGPTDEYGR